MWLPTKDLLLTFKSALMNFLLNPFVLFALHSTCTIFDKSPI